ncbi:prothoracicotropic hormone [Nilaparvata lugens]|uniref:Prothoracicotropic hormone n=1 Tax=Nilaparvata lugens TaxID=108931 RepID=U3U9Y4_NILLU|nr:prothoracicotropic hormone [Nilaparvata lugens]BAO00973.1 prothoracicotropic hormone [Nilaparvata lugens]
MLKVALVVLVSTAALALGRQWSEEEGDGGGLMVEGSVPLPCSCNSHPKLIDLGHESWPRYVTAVECRYESCWTSPYRCRERTYPVKVLRRRDDVDQMFAPPDRNLPEELRPSWKFVSVPVVVACHCSS